jgi:hypothetical protein
MAKMVEKFIAWFVAGLLVISTLAGLAVINVLVSLKYETMASKSCVSQITGCNLCWQLRLSQSICVGSLLIAFLTTLAAWLQRDKVTLT